MSDETYDVTDAHDTTQYEKPNQGLPSSDTEADETLPEDAPVTGGDDTSDPNGAEPIEDDAD